MEDEVPEVKVVKRKPGRPKNCPTGPTIPIRGIVLAPQDKSNVVELEYHNPQIFKKIFSMFKKYYMDEIEIVFDVDGIHMENKDHLKKSTVYNFIDGKCMDTYYCARKIRICVKLTSLDNAMLVFTKDYHHISLILKELDYRSKIYFIVEEKKYNSELNIDVDVTYRPESDAIVKRFDDSLYPLSFRFESKTFKAKINALRQISKSFIIQKVGDAPLQFSHEKEPGVNIVQVFPESELIHLFWSLGAASLNVSVSIDHLIPFTNSNIGDYYFIRVDPFNPISLALYLDESPNGWACVIKVFTEIQKMNPIEVGAK